ncbi:UPF0276 protein [Asanoa ishikariensis]|uniref:Uncharacterized protein n=1 Tax=Asanoa ishikariensis TaxID=137265 RepID=A0A1H3U8V2_9ACTN|nr:DUF692 domain-containing protein [Asanoa ishikariensis]GIF64118.1 UPF0276 protein [Asanoa ishikariensis]SDZ58511.1 hypothetical protein SAMN05421684_6720 [Asanoa ishikariensis]
MTPLHDLPHLGSGLGYRREIHQPTMEHRDRIDWLEVISEHYLFASVQGRERLAELSAAFPIVPHGIEMSIGTPGEVDEDYLDALAALVEEIDAPYFSDHLCFTRAGGVSLGSLTPLPRSRALAKELGRKAQRIQERVGVPFILENITYHVDLRTELTEAEFIAELCEHCECGLLLDLTNLHTNARNHGYDAAGFLDAIPTERVVQVHLAGGTEAHETLLDSHSSPVPEPVWALFDELLRRAPLKASLIERDQDFPDDFGELLGEVERARSAMRAAAPA